MTPAEYLSAALFPATSLPGLSFRSQMLIDAMNYDDLAAMKEDGRPMSDDQKARWDELQRKHAAREQVIAAATVGMSPIRAAPAISEMTP